MNMCLLEVATCEKCRSSHFQSEGGVKSLRTGLGGGGRKDFRTGGVIFAGGSVPHYMPLFFQISHNCVSECTMQARFLLKLKSLIKF